MEGVFIPQLISDTCGNGRLCCPPATHQPHTSFRWPFTHFCLFLPPLPQLSPSPYFSDLLLLRGQNNPSCHTA